MRRKRGDQLLVEAIDTVMHGCLFHRTDISNLKSIARHGLVSARKATELGIAPNYPGGSALTQTLDERMGLDNKVFLGFSPNRLMPKHDDADLRNTVILRVNPSILYRPEASVSLGPANRQSTRVHYPSKAFYEMDWDAIQGLVDDNDLTQRHRNFRVFEYEVLVEGTVPPELILAEDLEQTIEADSASPRPR